MTECMAVGTDENVMKKERDVSVRHLSLALVSGVFTHYSHLHHLLSDSNDHYCFNFLKIMLQVTGIQCQHHQLFQRQGLEEPHPPLDPHQHLQFLCGHLQHQPPPWGSSIFLCEFRLQLCSVLLPLLPRLCEWSEREGGGGGMVMLSLWALPLVVWHAPPSGPGCANDRRQREGVMRFSSVGPTLSCVSRSFNFRLC